MKEQSTVALSRLEIGKQRCFRVLLPIVLGGIAVCSAACGSGSAAPGVASLGSTTTTTPPAVQSQSNSSNYVDEVAYSACMRTHGVPNMPDPTSTGAFVFHGGTLNGVRGINPNSAEFMSANKDCEHLEPNGGQSTPQESEQLLAQALKYVNCLRSHGVPNMPDPTSSGQNVDISFAHTGLSPGSPRLQTAVTACRSLSLNGS
jgi:hypothetical protein